MSTELSAESNYSPWPASWRGDPYARPGHPDVMFEEGIGWDSDVPREFMIGMSHGDAPGPQPNRNQVVWTKTREDTMRERAHPGSASWVDSPPHLQSFVDGTSDDRRGSYAFDIRDGGHYSRPNPAHIYD